MTAHPRQGPSASNEKLFSIGQITLATFLGAPIAGCLLTAQNYRVLGKVNAAWQTLAVGIVLTVLVFIVAFALPENFPNIVLPVAYTVGCRESVKYLQGDVIASREAQGARGSWPIAIGVGIGCLVLLFGLILVGVVGSS